MGVLTTCLCGHDLTEHGENGPMVCLHEEECGCEGFVMRVKFVPKERSEEGQG